MVTRSVLTSESAQHAAPKSRAGRQTPEGGLMDTSCCGGGPKFPQCEPIRRIRRRGGPAVRHGRYPDRGVCRGSSRVRWLVWLAADRRELDGGCNAAV